MTKMSWAILGVCALAGAAVWRKKAVDGKTPVERERERCEALMKGLGAHCV